jgi:pre-rRNA-processing protein IPI3
MDYLLLISSANEGNKGISVNALNGSSLANNFKDSVVDTGALCTVGGSSSFAGQGNSCDYVVAAQSQKPIINVYHWGKSQIHYQCHIQEITTALACDPSGTYLIGGTKRGWIYMWELASGKLLTSFQAHYKSITQLHCTKREEFFFSASEDGMVRAWDLCSVVGTAEASSAGSKQSGMKPFRSWSPHTLAVKGMYVAEYGSSIRVLTCSMDRSVVVFDLYSNRQCHRISMPQALTSLTCNSTADRAFIGASNGKIFIVDLTLVAATKVASHVPMTTTSTIFTSLQKTLYGGSLEEATSTSILDGHTKAVVSLCVTSDDQRLISGSEDGTVRVWDSGTQQCLHDLAQPRAVSNVLVLRRPETLQNSSIYRPKMTPFEHLKKYTDNTKGSRVKVAQVPPTIFGSTLPSSLSGRVIVNADKDAVGAGDEMGLLDKQEALLAASAQSDVVSSDVDDEPEGSELPSKPDAGRKRAAELADATDFLSFASTPTALQSKAKKQK